MIFIVIPVFNRFEYTKNCIESLLNQSYNNYRIVVVDHGSSDGTSEYINAMFPDVVLLKGNESMWWTAATNMGINWVLANCKEDDYVLTLNNDLVVPDEYLFKLVKAAGGRKNSLIGSISVDIRSRWDRTSAGYKWNKWTAKYGFREHCSIKTGVNCCGELVPTDLLPGRGTLIPVSAFYKVGLYDEINFPHYTADDDFSLRCRYKGFALYISRDAVIYCHMNRSPLSLDTKNASLPTFLSTLTSIKSANNLKIRWRWAKKHAPLPLVYFFMDCSRIFGSFLKDRLSNTD
jgi:GT2 family glycosyltransferase